jgi:hypothetical protein
VSQLRRLSSRDLERLSTYLDGGSPHDADQVRSRLEADPEYRQALDDLRQVVRAVRGLPEVRPPRNFTLRPDQAGRRSSTALPYLRFATALASAAFILTTSLRLLSGVSLPLGAMAPAAAPAAQVQEEMFREAAGTSQPTSESAAMEADVVPPAAPTTPTPAGTPGPTSATAAAEMSSLAPAGTPSPPPLALGADVGAPDLEAPSDEVAGVEEAPMARAAPADPLAILQWVSGAAALFLLVLILRFRRSG